MVGLRCCDTNTNEAQSDATAAASGAASASASAISRRLLEPLRLLTDITSIVLPVGVPPADASAATFRDSWLPVPAGVSRSMACLKSPARRPLPEGGPPSPSE